MSNPTTTVPTESVPFSEEKVYWPLNASNTADTIYTGEMLGMRLDSGYANHFDDSTPMLFLGTKEGIRHLLQSDTPAADFKELIRRPRLFAMPLNTSVTASASIPGSIGQPAYAADSGHVQLSTSGLTNNNLAGMVVDIGRSGSTGSSGGILNLTGATSVVIAPPTFGALVGLVVAGLPGITATAAPPLSVAGGAGGASTGSTAAGAGGGFVLTLGAGGAAAGTGTGGTGGSFTVTAGAGGSSGSGTNGPGGPISLSAGAGIGAGTGGAVTIKSGASAGASGTAGAVTIDTGAATGGTAGAINVGTTNAGAVDIGNASGKIGFFGATAVVQPASPSGNTHTVTAGSTTNVFVNTTFDGGTGSTAYTIGDLVLALKHLGLLAA